MTRINLYKSLNNIDFNFSCHKNKLFCLLVMQSLNQRFIEHLNPMPHGRGRAALQMRDAADVGGHNHLGLHVGQVAKLAVTQLVGNRRLQYRVRARRAAAQMRFAASGFDVKAQRPQMLLNAAAQLLAVLQGAGRMKGNLTGFGGNFGP